MKHAFLPLFSKIISEFNRNLYVIIKKYIQM